MSSPISIGPLKKVVLHLYVYKDDSAGHQAPLVFSFIFGIGVDGLAGLEMRLAGKKAGDRIKIQVEQGATTEIFGHLGCELLRILGCPPPFLLEATIAKVSPADPREVVKAMAANTECDCDCGCGCF